MKSGYDVLIDTDAWLGSILKDDAHNEQTTHQFKQFKHQATRIVTTSYVIDETATVLNHKSGQATANQFIDNISKYSVPVMHVDYELRQQALKIFSQQNKRGTSMTDCINVALVRHLEIPYIFSFDKAYFKDFGLRSVLHHASV